MRGRRAVVPLLTLMLATLLELSSVAAKSFTFGEAQAAQAPAATELTGVEVGRNADGVTVTLKGNGKLAYGTLQEADRPPLRLVVDFPGVRPNVPPATPGQGALRRVRVALNNPNPLVTRVVLDLDVKVTYSVKASPDGREVTVVLAGPSGEQTAVEPARPAPMAAPVEAAPAAATAPAVANRLTGVVVGSAPEGVTLTLRGNGKLPVAEVEEAKDGPPRLVLSFAGVRPATTRADQRQEGPRRSRPRRRQRHAGLDPRRPRDVEAVRLPRAAGRRQRAQRRRHHR